MKHIKPLKPVINYNNLKVNISVKKFLRVKILKRKIKFKFKFKLEFRHEPEPVKINENDALIILITY